jgi:hypothetical protein
MPDDDLVTSVEFRSASERALTFQRYIFRRTYGIYYAVWALAIASFLILPFAVSPFLGTSDLSWIAFIMAESAAGLAATFVSIRNFGKAARTVALRNALNRRQPIERKYWLIIAWWVAFYIAIVLSFFIFRLGALSLVYGLLISVDAFVFTRMRRIFLGNIPIEGKIAIAVFGGSALASFVLSILGTSEFISGFPWIATIVAWLFSSLYALKHAPDELVELTH